MKSLIQEHFPEPAKVAMAALTFFGISLSDINLVVQISVGLAVFTYTITKTVKMWRKKKHD